MSEDERASLHASRLSKIATDGEEPQVKRNREVHTDVALHGMISACMPVGMMYVY